MILVPLFKVFPLGSRLIENEWAALDSQIYYSSAGFFVITVTF